MSNVSTKKIQTKRPKTRKTKPKPNLKRERVLTDVFIDQVQLKDEDTQQRADGTDYEAAEEYAELLERGIELPPPVYMTEDETVYWIVDGFARTQAAIDAGRKAITAYVMHGSKRDAMWESLKANSDHGVRRTKEDKRQAVNLALTDEEWGEYSDQIIAEGCAVSRQLVSKVRQELVEAGEIEDRDNVLGKDGRRTAAKKGGTTQDEEESTRHNGESNGTPGEASEDSEEENEEMGDLWEEGELSLEQQFMATFQAAEKLAGLLKEAAILRHQIGKMPGGEAIEYEGEKPKWLRSYANTIMQNAPRGLCQTCEGVGCSVCKGSGAETDDNERRAGDSLLDAIIGKQWTRKDK